LTDSEIRLRDAVSKKILLEVTLLKAIEARNTISLDSLLKQLNQLRNQGSVNVPPVTVAGKAPGIAPATQPTPKAHTAHQETTAHVLPAETPIPSADLTELWTKLIEAVGRVSSFTRSYLVDAHPVSFEKNLLTIGFDPEFEDHLGLVDNARNHTLLQTKLAELGHANCQIKFIKAEAVVGKTVKPAATASAQKTVASAAKPAPPISIKTKPAPVSFSKEDFKNDPLIQKALEIFKGQIVEVRT
jgi:DNA polymerase-3 subunit gamma/tau